MARLKCTSDPSGSNAYEFPRNPTEYDSQDSLNATSVEILHGAPAWQQKKWDGRPRVLRWYAIGATSTVDPTGAPMLDTMRTWVGNVRYFSFENLARINENWPNVTNWNKARVIDVKTEVRRGGELRYDKVELWLQPEYQ